MNKTVLGFVINVFGGRAGLFTATILPSGASMPITVRVSDLDGEPERFNERLLKVRLLREAMTNVEPVQVNYEEIPELGNEVNDVRRIARAHHLRAPRFEKVTGLVLAVRVSERDVAASPEEAPDTVELQVLDPNRVPITLRLSMQMAERSVAQAMLDMIQRAYADGSPLDFVIALEANDPNGSKLAPWIVSVATASLRSAEIAVDAFVESLSTCMIHGWPLAIAYLRTAPEVTGVARIVDSAYFRPEPITAVVSNGSPLFELLDRARAEGVRVRVGLAGRRREVADEERAELAASDSSSPFAGLDACPSRDSATLGIDPRLLVAVTIMAPLASAATPVWVRIQRESLEGPPVIECSGGVPNSDLSGVGVMSLQVPHRAAWIGEGCFNPGVYRLQIVAPVRPRIYMDCDEIECIAEYPHIIAEPPPPPAPEPVVAPTGRLSRVNPGLTPLNPSPNTPRLRQLQRFIAHICVCNGCGHELRVEFEQWRCGYPFEFDVFKLY